MFVPVCELGWAEELGGGGAFVCSYPGWQEGTKGLVVVRVDGLPHPAKTDDVWIGLLIGINQERACYFPCVPYHLASRPVRATALPTVGARVLTIRPLRLAAKLAGYKHRVEVFANTAFRLTFLCR